MSSYHQWKKASEAEGGKWHCWVEDESHDEGHRPLCGASFVEITSHVFGSGVEVAVAEDGRVSTSGQLVMDDLCAGCHAEQR